MITSVFNVEQNMVNVSPWRHRIICNILRPQHTRRRFQHQRALHLVQRSKPQQLSRNPYYFLSDIPLTSSTRTWLLHAWVVNLATVSLASSSGMFLFMYIFPGLHLSVCFFPFPSLSFPFFPFFPCSCFLSALHSLAGASAGAWGHGEQQVAGSAAPRHLFALVAVTTTCIPVCNRILFF